MPKKISYGWVLSESCGTRKPETKPQPAMKQGLLFNFLKFRRVTIRGAQPSARLSEEICLSEGSAGVSQRALRGLSEGSAGSLRSSAGVRGIFRGFSGVVTLCL